MVGKVFNEKRYTQKKAQILKKVEVRDKPNYLRYAPTQQLNSNSYKNMIFLIKN